jgi:hypothetical protein
VRFKQQAIIEFLIPGKISPINIHHHMEAVYGDKCVDVSTVWHRVQQWSGGNKSVWQSKARAEFRNLLNAGKSVLKLVAIMWKCGCMRFSTCRHSGGQLPVPPNKQFHTCGNHG